MSTYISVYTFPSQPSPDHYVSLCKRLFKFKLIALTRELITFYRIFLFGVFMLQYLSPVLVFISTWLLCHNVYEISRESWLPYVKINYIEQFNHCKNQFDNIYLFSFPEFLIGICFSFTIQNHLGLTYRCKYDIYIATPNMTGVL